MKKSINDIERNEIAGGFKSLNHYRDAVSKHGMTRRRNEIPHQSPRATTLGRNDGRRGGLTRMRMALIALVFCMGGGV